MGDKENHCTLLQKNEYYNVEWHMFFKTARAKDPLKRTMGPCDPLHFLQIRTSDQVASNLVALAIGSWL